MVLLTAINAKYIHSNLAVYCLKAYADRKYRGKVFLAEFTINNREEQILEKIYEKRPKVVAFSCYIWNIETVLSVAENLKKVLPEVMIILGGPEVSYNAGEILCNYPAVDLVMRGEGEETFLEFLDCYIEKSRKLSDIPGLTYRKDDKIIDTPDRGIMDLNKVAFPYRDMAHLENRIIYYETSRGCPFSCSYCLSSIDKKVRIRDFDKVRKELDFFLEKRVPQVKFVDRTFNCNHTHAYEIWKYIGEHDNGVTNFHFEISADLLREEDFTLFQNFRKGLIQLEIGVQSTNPKTIEAIRRKMDIKKVKEAVLRVHEGENIHQHLDLIAGLPFEDYESFQNSFNDVYAMKPDQLQLGFLKVLKGSYMGEEKDAYEVKYISRPPYEVLATKWLSYDDVLRLKQVEEMVEVYYNSFQFSASMAFLENYHKSPFDLYEKLGQYYKKHGYFDGGISRSSRYIILQRYFEEEVEKKEELDEIFREVLTYDLYLRDNVKNPPPFVKAWGKEENERLHAFYDREALEHKYLPDYSGYAPRQLSSMTHLRKFSLDMNSLLTEGKIRKETSYYLFDYKNRNPLNHSARVVKMEELYG